jgi:hypothetical protein
MKRLIILKEEWLELGTGKKKIGKEEEQRLRDAIRAKAIEQFKQDIKQRLDDGSIQIIKEYVAEPWITIEFEDAICWDVIDLLRTIDIVSLIDSILPKNSP